MCNYGYRLAMRPSSSSAFFSKVLPTDRFAVPLLTHDLTVLSVVRAEQALEDVADLPRERYPHEPFIGRIWALRDDFTAYDAACVALEEVLGAPLITLDVWLVRSRGHRANSNGSNTHRNRLVSGAYLQCDDEMCCGR